MSTNEENKEDDDAPNEEATDENEDDNDDEEPFRHFEVIGLDAVDANRSGHKVNVGDILRLKKTLVSIDDVPEEAVSCVLVKEGNEVGEVGYVPTFLLNDKMITENIDKHVQVVDLFSKSKNKFKVEKSKQNLGVAGVVILDEIPQME